MWAPNLLITGFVQTAHAQESLTSIANTVSNGLVDFFSGDGEGGRGANAYAGIAGFLLERVWVIVAAFTLLLLVRSGLKLIYGASEERFEEAKRAIANGLMAVVLVFLTSQLVNAFIRAGGSWNPEGGSRIFTQEMLGIVRWVEVLVVVLAIAMIIAAVFTAMFSMGGDDGPAKIRRAVFGAAAGIVIILLDAAFRFTFGLEYFEVPGTPSPFPLIERALAITTYFLTFMALIAVIIVIYAGIRMILSLGDEEAFKNMRSLIIRALLGLFVILTSIIIVRFVIVAFSG
jgi:hypothetical protein